MNDFFLSKDAFQNYFSELIGIIITVLLIPLIIRLSNRKLNFTKRHLAKKILFKLTTDYIDILTVNELRIEKPFIYSKRFDNFIIPYDVKSDFWQLGEKLLMEKYKKLKKKELNEEINKMTKTFESIYSELTDFYSNYSSVLSNSINKIYFQINFNIKTSAPFDAKDDDDLYLFIETWLSLLFSIVKLRDLLLKGLKKKEFNVKDLFYKPENI